MALGINMFDAQLIDDCMALRRGPSRSTRRRTKWSSLFAVSVLVGVTLAGAAAVVDDAPSSIAAGLPSQFVNEQMVTGLAEPDALEFSPDGRMFISERINGRLRVATQDPQGNWILEAEPFHTFDVPKNGTGQPEAVRSAGLRGIAFDPDFASTGFVYAFYMNDDTRQNRVVRIKADATDPNVSDAAFGEEILIDLPFNSTRASGSHNGGALVFGDDNLLYITTGDGWTGDFAGDSVQSLSTFTGKVLRIERDGSIPTDNPFVDTTAGDFRAIYALGLRNPYTVAKHPESGLLYINEARGDDKADIYIVAPGANYGHQGSGIGTLTTRWANSATGGAELITGGVWYPSGGPFPNEYHGAYFAAMWGGNNDDTGNITRIASDADTSVTSFETNVGFQAANGLANKPVQTRVGPDGSLYYLLTTYITDSGTVQRVRYTATDTVESPAFSPAGGDFVDSVTVSLSSPTSGAEIRYTLDASEPNESSTLYGDPLTFDVSTVLTAKAFLTGSNPSATVSASYTIGDPPTNVPPVVDAGPDRTVPIGEQAALDGSGSYDPDGNDELLFGEQWTQLSGPTVEILDPTEEVAYFVPPTPGTYRFRLEMSDGTDIGSDEVTITAIAPSACVGNALSNGDFDTGQVPWRLSTNGAASFSVVAGDESPMAQVTVSKIGTYTQIWQPNVEVTAATEYTLSFRARVNPDSGRSRSIKVHLLEHDDDFTNYGLDQSQTIGDAWATHSITFTTQGFGGSASVGRFRFQYGRQLRRNDLLQIDDVCLRPAAASPSTTTTTTTSPSTTTTSMPPTTSTTSTTSTSSTTTTSTTTSTTTTILPVSCVANVAANGDFAAGLAPWRHHTTGTGSASVVGEAAAIAVTDLGTYTQLYQSDLTLQRRSPYRLTFRARVQTGGSATVTAGVLEHDQDYTNYGLHHPFDIDDGWTTYSVAFTTRRFNSEVRDGRLRFKIDGVGSGAIVQIDDICFTAES